jgi:very-short-patch-repair endonuclease
VYDDVAIRLAAQHNGVVAVELLRQRGADATTIRALRSSRHWWMPSPQVLVRTGTVPTTDQTLTIAAYSAGVTAAVSHEPACWVWGLIACRTSPIDVVRTSRSGPRPPGTSVHTVRELPREWVTELRGIPVVRPELCALQLFASCRYERAERLVERLWSMRLLSGASLTRFIARMGERGRNGTAGVRRYLDARPPSYVPSASNTETRVMQILRDAGIEVRQQVDAGSEEAWTGRVDFVVRGVPVVIEVQSTEHHDALTDRESDVRRREALEAAGWIWVEVWSAAVWSDPGSVVRAVADAVALARQRRA